MLVSIKIIKLFINLICELIIPTSCKGYVSKPTNMRCAVCMSRRCKIHKNYWAKIRRSFYCKTDILIFDNFEGLDLIYYCENN